METRRDRLRAATVREITETARRILVEEGPEAVTLRAIARDMGMTAPALYRYFGSHQELLRHLIGAVFTEITDELHAAAEAVPGHDMSGKFLAVARRFRHWALAHPREYALLFGTPVRGGGHQEEADYAEECARRFGLEVPGPVPRTVEQEAVPGAARRRDPPRPASATGPLP